MKYLLDTCVISEIIRLKPSIKVTKWIKNEDESNFFISVLTIGELHKGIEKLDKSKRKEELHKWVENDLKERFWTRIIDIDLQTAMVWGKMPRHSGTCWQTNAGKRFSHCRNRYYSSFDSGNPQYFRHERERSSIA